MSQLQQLRCFTLVVEQGSFTKASEMLDISSTAVSKQVTQLEQQLGMTLVERSTRQLQITDLGLAVYEKAKRALEQVAELNQFAQTLQEEPQGTLNIASFITYAKYVILPHLNEFLTLYPLLNINLQVGDRVPNFQQENIDVYVGFHEYALDFLPSDFVAIPLKPLTKIVVAAPAYLEKYGEPKSIEEIKQHTYVTHSFRKEDSLLIQTQQQPKRIIYINDSQMMLQAIINGIGIGYMMDLVVSDACEKGLLKPILASYRGSKNNTYLGYKKRRYIESKIIKFKEFIVAKVKAK